MIEEDAPVNNVGSGAIAGTVGDPPVSRKAQKKIQRREKSTPTPVIINMMRRQAPAIAESSNWLGKGEEEQMISHAHKMIKQAKVKPHDSESARKLFMNQMPQVNAHRAAYHPEVKKHFATKSLKEDTFAGAMVFEVSSAVFHTAKLEKRKHKT